MPRLNVQQNNQNIIQAFKNALAIGRLKGIIASDGNHNFSTAGSNRNLLDNPWFTVNQRGVSGTISTANAYTVDRWKLSAGSVTISANGVSLLKVGSTQGAYREYIEYDRIKTNEQYTLSVMLQSGEVYSVTGTITPQTAQSGWLINKNFTSDFWGGIRAYSNSGTIVWDICFTSNNTSGVDFRAFKLELGSVSTLANDVPPNYAEELAKCKYYFERIRITSSSYGIVGTGVAGSTTSAYILVPFTPKRVTTYTITMSGSWRLLGAANHAVSSMTRPSAEPVNAFIATCASTGLTTGEALMLQSNNDANAYIDISADL